MTKNSLDNLANRDESVLKLSYVSYKIISEALVAGNQVRISKSMTTDEVLPFEVEVIPAGSVQDPLASTKEASIIKIRMLVTPDLSKIAGLALYSFIILNNDLSSKGFFITDSNREEMYLSILETGDETLIDKLEQYLNYRDEIESVAQLERKFATFRTTILSAATVDEVKSIEERFLADFYATF